MAKRLVTRRLPGFRFEAESPPLSEWLPRMDVACFVGFAASGPLDVPVPVESVTQFDAIFGEDARLAWDRARGAFVHAHLAPSVRAFFANGGRRCWVVRVARTRHTRARAGANPLNLARANSFPVPGLACAVPDRDGLKVARIVPAFARACSEGSWSDSLTVSAALSARPVQVGWVAPDCSALSLVQDVPGGVRAGDLLRLNFGSGEYLLAFVGAVESAPSGAPDAPRGVSVSASRVLRLRTSSPAPPPESPTPLVARVFTTERGADDAAPATSRRAEADDFSKPHDASLLPFKNDPAAIGGQRVTLEIRMPLEDAPAPGSVVTADVPGGQLLLTVEEIGIAAAGEGPAGSLVVATGRAQWWLREPPPLPAGRLPAGELLTFELRVRQADDYALTISDLGFGASHTRCWRRLPTDEQVYRADETAPVNRPAEELWQPLGERRFPLAADDDAGSLYFPLAMPTLADQFLPPARLRASALERDGLADFDAALFLDADLAASSTADLTPRADFIRYLGPSTRSLRGIHAALSLEEVTIISAPDAAHRGWGDTDTGAARLPRISPPFARPDWWHFLDCREHAEIPLVRRPQLGHFLDCGVGVVERPRISVEVTTSETGTYTVSWHSSLRGARFVLEESASREFEGAATIFEGAGTSHTLYGRSPGDYYYRVRAEVTNEGRRQTSDWSNGAVVRVRPLSRWEQKAEADYDPAVLLAVQRALLRLSASRADLLAVLSLPEHYREEEAMAHASLLRRAGARAGVAPASAAGAGAAGVTPLGGGEEVALSYGAIYHPWLLGREGGGTGRFRAVPPDGAAGGMLARRALARGAWVAPANEALRGVVALSPTTGRERLLNLQLAQVNVVRQEPRGFLALNADTLSLEEDLREISVRRLLILLRRLALREGAAYVFEPNSPAFRRLVERGFESMLDRLLARGAFAGPTAASSYQVVAGEGLNTRESVEAGRFVVELRVAPSLPLTFMTIRLVQAGDRGFVMEVR
jgi:hypothetical protein